MKLFRPGLILDAIARLRRAAGGGQPRPPLRTVPFPDVPPVDPEEEAEARRTGRRVVEHVLDTRKFLLGLIELYRTAMKGHEREELLACAERVAATLGVEPADVPSEGYYAEEPELTRYFRLMRGLRRAPASLASQVQRLEEYRRLVEVTRSPIYGRPGTGDSLIPAAVDPLTDALDATPMGQWAVDVLTRKAGEIARERRDYSLTGVAALAGDAVALAYARESMVLYEQLSFGRSLQAPLVVYRWQVDPEVAQAAQRFVDGFNQLFGPELPPATEQYTVLFLNAYEPDLVLGRCVAIGRTPDEPPRYYHWGIRMDRNGGPQVEGFWDGRLCTTRDYMLRSMG